MSSATTLKELNERLMKQPYVAGYTPSVDDAKYYRELFGDSRNVAQWAARMASYYPTERAEMKPRAGANESYMQESVDAEEL